MLKNKNMLMVFLAALLFLGTTAFESAAAQGNDNGNDNGNGNGQQSQTEHSSGSGSHHEDIDSGKDFGQHVSEHNDHFSGDHNPGNHRGYSGIKDN